MITIPIGTTEEIVREIMRFGDDAHLEVHFEKGPCGCAYCRGGEKRARD